MRSATRQFVMRLAGLFRRRRSDAELNDEIQSHLDEPVVALRHH